MATNQNSQDLSPKELIEKTMKLPPTKIFLSGCRDFMLMKVKNRKFRKNKYTLVRVKMPSFPDFS